MVLIINEDPIKEEHVSWYTEEESPETLWLIEIVLCTYRHPQSPEHALIQQCETKHRRKINRHEARSKIGHIIMLESVLHVMDLIEEK